MGKDSFRTLADVISAGQDAEQLHNRMSNVQNVLDYIEHCGGLKDAANTIPLMFHNGSPSCRINPDLLKNALNNEMEMLKASVKGHGWRL